MAAKESESLLESKALLIDGDSLALEDLEPVANGRKVALTPAAHTKLTENRQVVEAILEQNKIVYGITTGFGKFKDVAIKPEDGKALQVNLVRSHACGVGEYFDRQTCRTILLLRANALAKGYSGVRPELVNLICQFLNRGVHPQIPEKGSLGASGDLAPLAHLALVLMGEGAAEYQRQILPGEHALNRAGLEPISFEAKEAIALTNGTQMMAAVSSLVLLEAERLAKIADIIGAMSLEAQLGSAKAFSKEIHQVRPHPGQIASAANLTKLLANSALVESHADCSMVQDAYSLRCMPQVHGASRQAFAHARQVLEIEINSATDNPLVFADGTLSGGNFHGQPLALIADYMSVALAELANISERRTERLVNPALSNGLPAFLTSYGGLNSGLMVAQYTAASLVSENKSLAHPASVDSIPTSANQEDHVSMGSIAALKARSILRNLRQVLAIELMCAAQGLDFRLNGNNSPAPGPAVHAVWQLVRENIEHVEQDRQLYSDIAKAEELIASGAVLSACEKAIGQLA